ncbi:LOW QUALITY PROTEIN: vomeronasal type-1 receptor 4-like [Dugong dugon]
MMIPSDRTLGIFFICQLCIGLTGNLLLLTLYTYTFLVQPHLKKPIDMIVIHLTMANSMTIMFRLIPDVMVSFGVRFMDDVRCKAVLYIYRLTWGLSICTTSFLSAFQVITSSPSNSKWVWLQYKFSTYIFPSFFFFWIINMLIHIKIIINLEANRNFTVVGSGYHHVYQKDKQFEYGSSVACVSAMMIQDLLFVGLMIWTSVYMVSVLFRHHKRAQYLHSTSLSSQPSPENKATHSILRLVSCFVFFHFLNNCLSVYSTYGPQENRTLESITGIISSSYPTIYLLGAGVRGPRGQGSVVVGRPRGLRASGKPDSASSSRATRVRRAAAAVAGARRRTAR